MFMLSAGFEDVMADVSKEDRHAPFRQEVLEHAPELILQMGIDGPWIDQMRRRYGYTSARLYAAFGGKQRMVDYILTRHLIEAFEAVCTASDWQGPPMDVLRGMSLALAEYGAANLARHRVFLAEHERRPEAARAALAQRLVYLTNDFQIAIHAVLPSRRFNGLHATAAMLVGQLLHAPLWWPPDARRTVDAWVCTQIGLVTGLRRPDHRKALEATKKAVLF